MIGSAQPQGQSQLGAIAAGLGGLLALGLAPQVYGAEPALLGPVQVLLLVAVLVVTPLALALTHSRYINDRLGLYERGTYVRVSDESRSSLPP